MQSFRGPAAGDRLRSGVVSLRASPSTTRHLPPPRGARTVGSLAALTSRQLARPAPASGPLHDCISRWALCAGTASSDRPAHSQVNSPPPHHERPYLEQAHVFAMPFGHAVRAPFYSPHPPNTTRRHQQQGAQRSASRYRPSNNRCKPPTTNARPRGRRTLCLHHALDTPALKVPEQPARISPTVLTGRASRVQPDSFRKGAFEVKDYSTRIERNLRDRDFHPVTADRSHRGTCTPSGDTTVLGVRVNCTKLIYCASPAARIRPCSPNEFDLPLGGR